LRVHLNPAPPKDSLNSLENLFDKLETPS